MKKILILSGLSGSGKSTFAKRFMAEQANWLRVNRDDLRRTLLPVSLEEYWKTWPDQEKSRVETVVSELQKTAIVDLLTRGWNVLIDNTNLKTAYFREFRQLLSRHFDEVEIRYELVEAPLDECIRRDKNRPDSVGETVIRKQAEQLAVLRKNFKFQTEIITRNPVFQREQDESLPRCILVDIDGTVAKMGDRSPYDWHRVGIDQPNWPIIRLVKSLHASGYVVMFMSGRDAICRPETTAWINRYFDWPIDHYSLFMRSKQDHRKDSIVKQELFSEHILGKYYVDLVVDDRQQVVDMWRRTLGLPCIQVDYGDF